MTVIIRFDPHKASRAAAAIDQDEQPLSELRIAVATGQAQRLLRGRHRSRNERGDMLIARYGWPTNWRGRV